MKKVSYEIKRKRVKNINLRISRDGKVTVSAPDFVSESAIEQFVQSKQEFILKHVEKYRSRQVVSVANKDSIYLYGKCFKFKKLADSKFSYSVTDDVVVLYYRNLERDYERMLKELAKKYFNQLGLAVSQQMNLKNIEIEVKKFKSCYGKNYGGVRIALNYLLVHLDRVYVNHILYHEYAHCLEMNHSSKFYEVLSAYDSDFRYNRKYVSDNLWKYC